MADFRALCAELVDSVEVLLALRPAEARTLWTTEDRLTRARAALSESEDRIGYPSPKQLQHFMFEAGFEVPDPDLEPAFPRAEYRKLAAKIVDWTLAQTDTSNAEVDE